MVRALVKPEQDLEIVQIEKGLARVGLKLSKTQLNELNIGNIVTLETMELGEIGSVFILALAVFGSNSRNRKKLITFEDLSRAVIDCRCCSGIPIHCWNSDSVIGNRCLHLTVLNSVPAVRVCCKSKKIESQKKVFVC